MEVKNQYEDETIHQMTIRAKYILKSLGLINSFGASISFVVFIPLQT